MGWLSFILCARRNVVFSVDKLAGEGTAKKLFSKPELKDRVQAFKEMKPLFKMKSKRSSSYLNLNIFKYNYNNKNQINLINNNDVATSGSINYSFQEELSSEEIHFKAVKYYQEIKKENNVID